METNGEVTSRAERLVTRGQSRGVTGERSRDCSQQLPEGSSPVCPIDGLGMTFEGEGTTDPATNRVTCEFGHYVAKAHQVEYVDRGCAE